MKSNQVITGDCIEVMKTFPEESVGMILTSPPYNVGLNYLGYDDNLPEDEFREFNREWLSQAFQIAKESARLYVIISDRMLWWFREAAEDQGWKYSQILVWCKNNIMGKSRISGDWNRMTEWIFLFVKGKTKPMISGYQHGFTSMNYFVGPTPQSNFKEGRHHPAQISFNLCKKIISRTPGDPVLDPFCGSGQVLRAAKSMNRDYIGIELVPEVAKRAREFINNVNFTKNEKQSDFEIMREGE